MEKCEFSTESIFQSLNHQDRSCFSFWLIRQWGEMLVSRAAVIHSYISCVFAFRRNFIHLSRETGQDKFPSCVGGCSHEAHSNKAPAQQRCGGISRWQMGSCELRTGWMGAPLFSPAPRSITAMLQHWLHKVNFENFPYKSDLMRCRSVCMRLLQLPCN